MLQLDFLHQALSNFLRVDCTEIRVYLELHGGCADIVSQRVDSTKAFDQLSEASWDV